MTDKHTPGPWFAQTYVCSREGTIEYGYTFKRSDDTDDSEFDVVLGETLEAETIERGQKDFAFNAHLIAAAPDMLAVLQTLTREGVSLELYAAARAAIDKATQA